MLIPAGRIIGIAIGAITGNGHNWYQAQLVTRKPGASLRAFFVSLSLALCPE
jgi:hypothetical protein